MTRARPTAAADVARTVETVVGERLAGWLAGKPASGRSGTEPSEVPGGGKRMTLVVGFSGGLDSCVLLHLLRFRLSPEADVVAAHFDHASRPGSSADAAWARGLCSAWGVALETETREGPDASAMDASGDPSAVDAPGGRSAVETPRDPSAVDAPTLSEEDARTARYAFLHRVRRRMEPALLLTAHHADDQAETVLFRVLRGTGIEGLAGIPDRRSPGIVRPLLPLWRRELESYAHRHGLSWRDDPTNETLSRSRNVIRHRLLPLAEDAVAPGARRSLVRLADIAAEESSAWAEALEMVARAVDARRGSGAPGDEGEDEGAVWSVDRRSLRALGPGLRARLIRHLAATPLDRATTRRASDFAACGGSGKGIELGSGLELRRELDRMVLRRVGPATAAGPDVDVEIDMGPGHGEARLGGRRYRVRWTRPGRGAADGLEDAAEGRWEVVIPLAGLSLPFRVRARRPGDRVELPAGSRKVSQLLLEARIPSRERERMPLLVDGVERVLWIPGVVLAASVGERGPRGSGDSTEARSLQDDGGRPGAPGRETVASDAPAELRVTIEPAADP